MAVRRLASVLQDLRRVTADGAAHLGDAQLLEQFIEQRDELAFTALIRRHSAMVWGVCRRIVTHHHDAEDAFQATFLVLARKAASVRPRTMLANWLYGVAQRTALKARTLMAKRRGREKQVMAMPEPESKPQAMHTDLDGVIDQELAALPDKYRVAIVLCDLEGKTGREAARLLQIPEGTLAGHLRRGRLMLAKRLARHGLAISAGSLATLIGQPAPAAIVSTTIKTATLIAAGKTAAGTASANVAALTEGMIKAMLVTKLKSVAAAVLVISALSGTAGFSLHAQDGAESGGKSLGQKKLVSSADGPPQKAREELDQATKLLWKAEVELRQAHADFEAAAGIMLQARSKYEGAKEALADAQRRFDRKAIHRAINFHVIADSEEVAQVIAYRAEAERTRLAKLWLGHESPPWKNACLVHVSLMEGRKAHGYARYDYDERSRFSPRQEMYLEGPNAAAIQVDVLPQQVMHTLLAHELGTGYPRWVEAGVGFMTQSPKARHGRLNLLPKAIKDGITTPLDRLFEMRGYPTRDLEVWHAQCLSVCQFLVERKDRPTLLAFVQRGMERGWEDAVRRYYGFKNIDEMHTAWHLAAESGPGLGRLLRVVYPIDDLVRDKDGDLISASLIRAITKTIEPDSWQDRGGRGSIHYSTFGKALVVEQTHEGQGSVEKLLEKLRRLAEGQKKDALPPLLPFSPNADLQGEVLKVQIGELSVSILIESNKELLYLTSDEEKKLEPTYRIHAKTVVLRADSNERMKFADIKTGDRLAVELDRAQGTVKTIRVHTHWWRSPLPVATDEIVINTRKFAIPIQVESRHRDLKSVTLYYSADLGKTWTAHQVCTAEEFQKGFQFETVDDGVFWFSVVIEHMDGRSTPADYQKGMLPVHLKVRVDTSKPARAPSCVLIGSRLQNMVLNDSKGKSWEYKNDAAGKLVLLSFWGTNCVHCQDTLPALERLHQQYRKRGLEVVGIALEAGKDEKREAEAVNAFASKAEVTFRQLLGRSAAFDDVSKQFRLEGIPTLFLLNHQGEICWQHTGRPDFQVLDALERSLQLRLPQGANGAPQP